MKSRAQIGIIGAGSWGTALALALARQNLAVALWAYEPALAVTLERERENTIYLPGFRLPANIHSTNELEQARAPLLLLATPSHALRATLHRLRPLLEPSTEILLATKGLEAHSLLSVSAVAREVLGAAAHLATLSGPTFAREVAAGEPCAVVVASNEIELGESLQRRLSSPTLRLYTSTDVVGVELGASLKNVIAIASGICQGLGLGSNTRAALIARGLAEISRLACAQGARAETLAGLAGLGDLVLTCTGELSRNRAVGMALGQGERLEAILSRSPMVAEGVPTTAAAHELAQRLGVDLPITNQMRKVLFEQYPPRLALDELMRRPPKPED